jgi:hypothetical protein
MSDHDGTGRAPSTRLNVDLGDRLAADVETLRRLIQDALPYRQRVTMADVVRIALDALHLSQIKHEAHERPLTPLETHDATAILEHLQHEPSCPAWVMASYLGLLFKDDHPEIVSSAGKGRGKSRKPKL